MASLNLIVSEIVHIIGEPNNYALREHIRNSVIHTRNELIRRTYENHNYVDSVLQQRFKVNVQKLTDLNEEIPDEFDEQYYPYIYRTVQKVPRPVRLINNLPFTRVSTKGSFFNNSIPYIKQTSSRFRRWLPGMRGQYSYDYINDYLYIFPNDVEYNSGLGSIANAPYEHDIMQNVVIEAAFEYPTVIKRLNGEGSTFSFEDDDNEWFLPEDMIGTLKEIILKREINNFRHENNETPNTIKNT